MQIDSTIRKQLAMVGWLLASVCALTAYPPAPHHVLFGLVRDEFGTPLNTVGGEVILEATSGVLVRGEIGAKEPGVNFRLPVRMDAGLTADLYKPTALRPTVPFKVKVRIGRVTYLPIEMRGDYSKLGLPGEETRLDLTLGEDSDGDGLPDTWERSLIVKSGGGRTLMDVRPTDDLDGDGLSNLQEYLAGTYAFDSKNGLALKAIAAGGDEPLLEFVAVRGRSYSILSSPDFSNWTVLAFTIPANGPSSPELSTYRSEDVRLVRVKVKPPGEAQVMKFFKLMAQ
ncbi:MAG: hypothetical protein JNN07_14720 [Verrucomicrobiales bacterium]|nr:hypothetical protein [Verrucomicrobiales bacterium]